jgi:hypothetical protein
MWLKTGRPEPGVGDAVSSSDAVGDGVAAGLGTAVGVGDGVAGTTERAAVDIEDPHPPTARATLRAQRAHLVPTVFITPEL